jgi:GT2 family glycosyltransferase
VHGMGIGCTLIRRDIFNTYMFWYDERFSEKHSDVYFYMELQNKGIPVYLDTNIIIEHYPSKWEDVKDK